jgi:hypothetical protein
MTLNNPTEEEIQEMSVLPQGATYLIWEEEKGANGTPHLQMYVHFQNATTMKALKKRSGTWYRMHLEVARGTGAQNTAYCSKEHEAGRSPPPTIIGVMPAGNGNGGANAVLAEACELVQAGSSTIEIAEKFPMIYVQHFRGLQALQAACQGPFRDGYPPGGIWWLWGPTGGGKSRNALSVCGPEHSYIKPESEWWDRYEPTIHQAVIWNDIREPPKAARQYFRDFLTYCDRYAKIGQTKGGTVVVRPDIVFITTPLCPWRTFAKAQEEGEQIDQLLRRIGESGGGVLYLEGGQRLVRWTRGGHERARADAFNCVAASVLRWKADMERFPQQQDAVAWIRERMAKDAPSVVDLDEANEAAAAPAREEIEAALDRAAQDLIAEEERQCMELWGLRARQVPSYVIPRVEDDDAYPEEDL